jgi:uncharacterized protein YbbC (DUF1343 family)
VASRVATGLDRVASGEARALKCVAGRRIGLLAHPASVDRQMRHARQVLAEAGCEIGALFAPEHGFGGEAQDMARVDSSVDEQSGIPVYSLYGQSERDLGPRAEWLGGLDAVVVDLQDVGSRYYTFAWTAALMLKAAAARGVQTVVLDRPNPLGGEVVEGRPQRQGFRSFVGLYDVSVRHGMTLGELCTMVRRVEKLDPASLLVVPLKGWKRRMLFRDTGLEWVLPSPNMPSESTARVYPGGCLLEGTNLSEGRGTTRPFEIWGAPFLDGRLLAERLGAEGALLRPLAFRPVFHKHAGRLCGGLQVHVTDPRAFRPYTFYLGAIAEARRLAGEALQWRTETYEFVSDRPAIDLLTGGPEFRRAVDSGAGLDELLQAEQAGAEWFQESRQQDLLYRGT